MATRVAIAAMDNGTALVAGSDDPAAGATAQVYTHGTTDAATVYSAETGGTTLTLPLTANSNGQFPGWLVAEMDYDIVVTYQSNTAPAALLTPMRGTDVGCGFFPSDHGILAWAFPPEVAASQVAPIAAGRLTLTLIKLPVEVTVTNVILGVATAGGTLTANQCLAGLFQNGNLIGSSADQSTNWTSVGVQIMALTGGPFVLDAGEAYVGWYYQGTTAPKFACGPTGNWASGVINIGITSTAARFGIANTGLTTALPGSIGTISTSTAAFWAALS